jgi:hypothetical protein
MDVLLLSPSKHKHTMQIILLEKPPDLKYSGNWERNDTVTGMDLTKILIAGENFESRASDMHELLKDAPKFRGTYTSSSMPRAFLRSI